jgi:transposase
MYTSKIICIKTVQGHETLEEKHRYRKRWIVESVFSSFKRTFGKHISSIKRNNIVNELILNASIYNTFIEKTIL